MKGPIARGTIRTTLVLSLRLIVQSGTLLLVARMLGPHQFGAFAGVAALAVMLGAFATFGTHLVLLGQVATNSAKRDDVLVWALPTTLLTGGALLAVYLAVCVLALGESGIPLRVLLVLGFTETLLQPFIALCAAEHQGLGRIARSQFLMTLPLALRLMAAAAVLAMQVPDRIGLYAYGYCLASAVSLVLGWSTLRRPWPHPTQWHLPGYRRLQGAVGFAALSITAAGPTELDKTLATKLLPLDSAGLYAVGARVIGAITLPISAMTASALPRLFRGGAGEQRRDPKLSAWMFGSALTYSGAAAALLWVAAPLLDHIFGSKYYGAGQVVRWLCFSLPGLSLRRVAGNILMAHGKPWVRVAFETIGIGVLIVAALLFARAFTTETMPLALACSEWSMAIVGMSYIWAIMKAEAGRKAAPDTVGGDSVSDRKAASSGHVQDR